MGDAPLKFLAPLKDTYGWLVLGALLFALLVSTLVNDRTARPPDEGEEPTYALQASSLAWDFDLLYSQQDYRRYVDQWGVRPRGIDLESRDGGRTQVFARPFHHALLAVPFVRVMPYRGLRVANVLLLAAAAFLTARTLARRQGMSASGVGTAGSGSAAPLWVAAFVFASAAFSYVFLATADVFLLAVTAIGFSLVFSDGPALALSSMYQGTSGWAWRTFGRWAAIGALLAIPGTYRLPYLLLLIPAAIALNRSPSIRRQPAWLGLLAGALALFALTAFVQIAAGAEPFWAMAARKPLLDPALLGWNAWYFLAGRNVGLLPYFLPVLLAFSAYRKDQGRWALLAAAGLASLGFLLLRPYDFAGVAGTVGNRLFLPLYAALWFLPFPVRPLRASWALVTAALAAPLLFPLWMSPATPHPVPARIADWLPYEATQQDLPGEWMIHDGIRVKPISSNLWRAETGSDLRIAGAETGHLVVASLEPLRGLTLDFDRNAPSRLIANGSELRPTILRADGSVSFDVALGSSRTHPMGWTGGEHHIYEVSFRLPEAPAKPIGFRIRASQDLIEIQKSRG